MSDIAHFKSLSAREFRSIRAQLGFTAEVMARLCGASGGRVVRKWESGTNAVPEGVSRFLWVLMKLMSQSLRSKVIDLLLEG